MTFDIGPFHLRRCDSGTLEINLLCLGDVACGWEYGWRDDLRGTDKPIIEFRIGKLMILYVSPF